MKPVNYKAAQAVVWKMKQPVHLLCLQIDLFAKKIRC